MKHFCFYSLLFCALGLSFGSNKAEAQDSLKVPETLGERFGAYVNYLSPEKVYLHTDKDVYAIGDTIWFKAYCANRSVESEYPESRYIYVELIGVTYAKDFTSGKYTDASYVMQRIKVKQRHGILEGYVPVPDDANTGYATLRAFSYWNLNKDADYMFSKELTLINPVKDNYVEGLKEKEMRDNSAYEEIGVENPFNQRKLAPKFDCSFLPESGRLLKGVNCRVGVKIVNELGLGQQAEGKVYDHNDVQVASFSTDEYGFGSFYLSPVSDEERYYARIEDVRGISDRIRLPEVESQGAAISLKPGKEMIQASVSVSGIPASDLRFILCNGDEIYYEMPVSGPVKFNLPVGGMSPGINNAILCTSSGDIYAKRPFFVYPETLSNPTISSHKKDYGRRDNISVDLDLGRMAGGDFSVSVTDNLLAPVNSQGNSIVSYMFLSSEIRGNVENPQRFFADTIPFEKRMNDVDLMLMTQGWEYYDLPAILSGQFPMPKYGREYVQSISGQVERGLLKKKKASMVIFLAPSIKFAAAGKIDEEGFFELKDLNFPDSTTFIVSATNVNGNRSLRPVIFEDSFAPLTTFVHNREKVAYTPKVAEIYKTNYYNSGGDLSYQLNSITVYGKKKSLSGISPLTNWEFQGDQIREGKRLEPYKSYDLINYLAETCQGLRLSSGEGTRMLLCRVPASASNWSVGDDWVPIQVFLNGMRVSDWMELEGMMMDDVEAVVYLKGIAAAPFSMGSMGYGTSANVSVVLVKTKTDKNVLWHLSYGRPLGWQRPRHFYAPKYEVDGKGVIPNGTDRRSTLYWNPSLTADGNGKISFRFNTSDLLSGYTVTLEGVTTDGEWVSKRFDLK